MLRKSQLQAIALGSVAWIAALSAAHTGQPPAEIAHPGVARIVSSVERPDARAVSGLPQGIRSYGKGAVRIDLSAAGVVTDDGSKADESSPGVDATTKISGASMAGSVSAFTVSPASSGWD